MGAVFSPYLIQHLAPIFIGGAGVLPGVRVAWSWNRSRLLSPGLSKRKKRRERRVLLQLEELETRALLSASAVTSGVQPLAALTPQQQPGRIPGYTPQQIEQAYGVSSLLSGGTTGAGKTIAIVDASYDPNITADVAAFDKQFGLQAFNVKGGPTLSVVTSNGTAVTPKNGPSLGYDSGWALEIALDVEWAHSMAPGANIVLVEVPVDADNTQQLNDLVAGVQYAAKASNVVSMSWGLSEFKNESSLDKIFQTAGNNVTFVAASGDSSAFFGPIWPATSPYVLAVGGTSLQTTTSGGQTTYTGESGWFGSGGGFAAFEGEPNFQANNPSIGVTDSRLTPDVAFDANPSTGVAVYDSFKQASPWLQVGGTSLGSPAWAGIVALADQQRGRSLDTYQVQTTLYNTLHNPTTYKSTFHDITRGYNGYSATAGYDLVAGLGTPIANNLVPLLAKTTASAIIPSNFITGAGTDAFSSSSSTSGFAAAAGNRGGAGLFTTGGSPTLTANAPAASTAPVVPVLTLPTALPSLAPAIGEIPGIDNTLVSFNLSAQTAQPVATTASVNVPASANAAFAQANTVFGASGWNSLNSSLHLSILGLHGPSAEDVTDDLAGSLFEVQEQTNDSGASAADNAADDAPALDDAPAVIAEGDAGVGGGE
jgi:subtilase family serine protease